MTVSQSLPSTPRKSAAGFARRVMKGKASVEYEEIWNDTVLS